MNNLKVMLITSAIIVIIIDLILVTLITPSTYYLQNNYIIENEIISTGSTRFNLSEDWTEEQYFNGFSKTTTTKLKGDNMQVNEEFIIKYLNKETYYESQSEYNVNRKTKKTEENVYAFFPNNLEKKSYIYSPRGYSGKSFKFDFVNEEEILGITTYHLRVEDAEYDQTDSYSWLGNLLENRSVKTVFTINYYVEPRTGIIINYMDSGINSYYDQKSDKVIGEMDKWSNKFNENEIIKQVVIAKSEIRKTQLFTYILPGTLAIIAITLLTLGLTRGGKKK